ALAERADGDHVDLDHARARRPQRTLESGFELANFGDPLVVQPDRSADERKVRSQNIRIHTPAAVLRVLDVADDAITAIVHQQEDGVGAGLNCRGELADHELRAAITEEGDGLGVLAGQRRANAHGDALADPAAERMNTEIWRRDAHVAI